MEYTIKKYEEQEKAKPKEAVEPPPEPTQSKSTGMNTVADAS